MLLRGRVDTDEDEVGLLDGGIDVGREGEVAATGLLDHLDESGLIDGELVVGAVPRVDTCLAQVDDGDLNLRALEGDDSACWSTCEMRAARIVVLAMTRRQDSPT